jgi:hypothetical protein
MCCIMLDISGTATPSALRWIHRSSACPLFNAPCFPCVVDLTWPLLVFDPQRQRVETAGSSYSGPSVLRCRFLLFKLPATDGTSHSKSVVGRLLHGVSSDAWACLKRNPEMRTAGRPTDDASGLQGCLPPQKENQHDINHQHLGHYLS